MTSNLQKCDCLNYCGDDPWLANGKADYCADHKAKVNQAALTEVIGWTLTAVNTPEPMHLVLGFSDESMEQIVVCSFDGAVWRYHDDELWFSGPKAWAKMPFGPRNTKWMKVRRV